MLHTHTLFRNSNLYKIEFSPSGRDIDLHFTDTITGKNLGRIHCSGILGIILETNQYFDYCDPEDGLFPYFVPELTLTQYAEHSEIMLNAGIFLKITAAQITCIEQAMAY